MGQFEEIIGALPSSIELVEFTEPSLAADACRNAFTIEEIGAAYEGYKSLLKKCTKTTLLQVPDGDYSIYRGIFGLFDDLPFSGFGVDLTETKWERLLDFNLKGKILSAGVLSAWTSAPQDIEAVDLEVRTAARLSGAAKVYVTTNAQLYHTISHEPAMRKINELAEIVQRLQ